MATSIKTDTGPGDLQAGGLVNCLKRIGRTRELSVATPFRHFPDPLECEFPLFDGQFFLLEVPLVPPDLSLTRLK